LGARENPRGVDDALPIGHQHLDTLPDHLVAGVSKQGLRLCIDLNNEALLIYGSDCVRNCFQDRSSQNGFPRSFEPDGMSFSVGETRLRPKSPW
jgi:hypothetical protein